MKIGYRTHILNVTNWPDGYRLGVESALKSGAADFALLHYNTCVCDAQAGAVERLMGAARALKKT